MPEGHTVQRIADQFQKNFGGKQLQVDSPQGRFSSGAQLISGQGLVSAKAIGKQMFLLFENGLTLRIHLGIYGKWNWVALENSDFITLPSKGEVRARFYTQEVMAELRGPTVCEVLNDEDVALIAKRLGPDPLNADPKGLEKLRFIQNIRSSKTPIGLLLMNQAIVAGIGNVYRAELLFRAQINPYTPGNQLAESQVVELWNDSVKLLKVGVKTSYMITRDELFTKNPSKEERNFVYKREGQPCRICETKISLALEGGRKLYWCANCQK